MLPRMAHGKLFQETLHRDCAALAILSSLDSAQEMTEPLATLTLHEGSRRTPLRLAPRNSYMTRIRVARDIFFLSTKLREPLAVALSTYVYAKLAIRRLWSKFLFLKLMNALAHRHLRGSRVYDVQMAVKVKMLYEFPIR